MSDMDRREFLSKSALAAGGALACALLAEDLRAEEFPLKHGEASPVFDEESWIGGV